MRDSENTESVSSEFELLVKKIHRKWSEAKMLISMGISRGDSVKVNNKMLEYIQYTYIVGKYKMYLYEL